MRYWVIGTSAHKMINVFIDLVNKKNLNVGSEFIASKQNGYHNLISKAGRCLWTFHSQSTCRQYLKTWEALGLVCKKNHSFIISTMIKEYDFIVFYTLLFIVKESYDEDIQAYRNTIIINILVEAKEITFSDLKKRKVEKTKGELKMEDIHKAISKYEKKLAKSKELLKILKDKYDGKF